MSGDEGEGHPYGFPFPPYTVQQELMDAISHALDSRAVALFESPTGTGKTLSVICSTMTWLQKHQLDSTALGPHTFKSDDRLPASADGSSDPDWVSAQASHKVHARLRAVHDRRTSEYEARVLSARRARGKPGIGSRGLKAPRLGASMASSSSRQVVRAKRDDDSKYLLAEEAQGNVEVGDGYESSSSSDGKTRSGRGGRQYGDGDDGDIAADTAPRLRLIFATRTHSQLSQFVSEIRKTKFGPSSSLSTQVLSPSASASLPLSAVTFGSRKVMCINDNVRSLSTSAAVSERCRELLKGKDKQPRSKRGRDGESSFAKSGCPFKNDSVERSMRDIAIVELHDVEEMSAMGASLGGCPYFASRAAIASGAVDVIGVPYTALLHKPTRESLGIAIDEQTVIVFDEAHNLVDTVNDIHAASLPLVALKSTRAALGAYLERYKQRLAPGTLFSVNQIIALADGLLSVFTNTGAPNPGAPSDQKARSRVVSPAALIFEARVDHLNIFQLSAFLETSRLCQKLLGFIDAGLGDSEVGSEASSRCLGQDSNGAGEKSLVRNVEDERRLRRRGIASFEGFLTALNAASEGGRIAIYDSGSNTQPGSLGASDDRLKFFVLDPGSLFSSTIEKARSVILVGGTLSPRRAIRDALFPSLPQQRPVHELECEHIVPQRNLGAYIVSVGASGKTLEFTRHTRQDTGVIDDLGNTVLRVARSSPGGVIVFFASYGFMATVTTHWSRTGCAAELNTVKPVFYETRGDSGVFDTYADTVRKDSKRGALLIAVLGGRLSEGVNFSDELGRVVMIVGMPFANASDIETAAVLSKLPDAKRRAEHLENKCLTVVNQAIGRAIRHLHDFAVIVLCDRRYARLTTIAKLPRFVRQSIKCVGNKPDVGYVVTRFFADK